MRPMTASASSPCLRIRITDGQRHRRQQAWRDAGASGGSERCSALDGKAAAAHQLNKCGKTRPRDARSAFGVRSAAIGVGSPEGSGRSAARKSLGHRRPGGQGRTRPDNCISLSRKPPSLRQDGGEVPNPEFEVRVPAIGSRKAISRVPIVE